MAYLTSTPHLFRSQMRFDGGVESMTLTGDLVLTGSSANWLSIDAGGATRDVTLPDVDQTEGVIFEIYNASDAAEDLTIKDAAGSTVTTISQNGSATIGSTGSAWVVTQSTAPAASVGTSQIQNLAVTAAKIADATITGGKVATTFAPLPVVADPGTTLAIPVTGNADISLTVAAAGETNTLADPTFRGQRLRLYVGTFTASATRAITAASPINVAGNTIMTFNAQGDFAELVAIGATPKWKIVANDGVALS